MAEHKYHFDVAMSCSGCSGAIDRVLKKMDGTFAAVIADVENSHG
jgi:copper chaperone CopZ